MVLQQFRFRYGWLELLVSDIWFMWSQSDNLYSSMPNPRDDLQAWVNAIAESPRHWKSTFLRISDGFKGKFRFSEGTAPNGAEQVQVHPAAVITCDKCSYTCESNQQLLTHMFHQHEYRNPIQLRMKTTACLRCKTEYHSRHRLYRHISNRQSKNKCFSFYMELEPMPIDELEALVANCPTVDKLAFVPPPVKCA